MSGFLVDGNGDQLMNADRLACELGVSRRWVYRQAEENGLPTIRLGRSVLFQLSAIRQWLAENTTTTAKEQQQVGLNERSGRRHGRPDYVSNTTKQERSSVHV